MDSAAHEDELAGWESCYPVSTLRAVAGRLRERANGIEPTIDEVIEELERDA